MMLPSFLVFLQNSKTDSSTKTIIFSWENILFLQENTDRLLLTT